MVINACDKLYQDVINHKYDEFALPLLHALNIPVEMLSYYAKPFSKEGLTQKVKKELGELAFSNDTIAPNTIRRRLPLGILFHIAAGNVDLLPAYSVIEGLLTGNINLLKLPTGDNGLSIKLLSELIRVEPKLTNFIYVFDVPSTELDSIKKLSEMADATIVWGGEAAAKAAKEFTDIHSKLIVWGHKLSFAYVDSSVSDEGLTKLAESICFSNQLLCSSPQGIYVNTNEEKVLKDIAERFLPILIKCSKMIGDAPLTMRAKKTLTIYNDKLEGKKDPVLTKDGVSIRILNDSKLELSYLYRDVWIKPLLSQNIVATLKPNKGLLQTVQVEVLENSQEEITNNLLKAGVTKIVNLGEDFKMIPGDSHDGEYPLLRYSRIVGINHSNHK